MLSAVDEEIKKAQSFKKEITTKNGVEVEQRQGECVYIFELEDESGYLVEDSEVEIKTRNRTYNGVLFSAESLKLTLPVLTYPPGSPLP